MGVLGGLAGGLVVGGLVGAAGSLVDSNGRGASALLAVAIVAIGLLIDSDKPTQRDKETPQFLLHFGDVTWAFTNGTLLGAGFTSRLGYWLWYLIPITAFASGSFVAGAVIWGAYGFVRMMMAGVLAAGLIRGSLPSDSFSTTLFRLRQATKLKVSAFTYVLLGVALVVIGF